MKLFNTNFANTIESFRTILASIYLASSMIKKRSKRVNTLWQLLLLV